MALGVTQNKRLTISRIFARNDNPVLEKLDELMHESRSTGQVCTSPQVQVENVTYT
jgi:hypothetical protein